MFNILNKDTRSFYLLLRLTCSNLTIKNTRIKRFYQIFSIKTLDKYLYAESAYLINAILIDFLAEIFIIFND